MVNTATEHPQPPAISGSPVALQRRHAHAAIQLHGLLDDRQGAEPRIFVLVVHPVKTRCSGERLGRREAERMRQPQRNAVVSSTQLGSGLADADQVLRIAAVGGAEHHQPGALVVDELAIVQAHVALAVLARRHQNAGSDLLAPASLRVAGHTQQRLQIVLVVVVEIGRNG
ncbi:hypothetical protein D3C81_1358110 [compost metagenome]